MEASSGAIKREITFRALPLSSMAFSLLVLTIPLSMHSMLTMENCFGATKLEVR